MKMSESKIKSKSKTEPRIELAFETHPGKGKIARVTVDYQARINILNTPLMIQLASTIRSLRDHPDLRAMILTGAGDRAFLGGADINEMAGLRPDTAREFITRLHAVCFSIRELPVPVIARIRGFCLGGGLEIAASCDLRVASDDSQFGMPEVRVGIPSVIEAALLPRLMGWGKARELVFTGDMISATEALACGLVERVVPKAELDSAVARWVDSLLQCGPAAIRSQKALIRDWEFLPLDQAIEKSITTFGEAFKTEEPGNLMRGFLNRARKKKPKS